MYKVRRKSEAKDTFFFYKYERRRVDAAFVGEVEGMVRDNSVTLSLAAATNCINGSRPSLCCSMALNRLPKRFDTLLMLTSWSGYNEKVEREKASGSCYNEKVHGTCVLQSERVRIRHGGDQPEMKDCATLKDKYPYVVKRLAHSWPCKVLMAR